MDLQHRKSDTFNTDY